MADNKLFSRSLRGYSPEEVIAYIEELDRSAKSSKEELEARIDELLGEIDALRKVDEENAGLKEKIAEAENKISGLEEENARLRNDAENQRLALTAQGDKLSEAESEKTALKADLENAAVKIAAMEKNAKDYEEVLSNVNTILATARRDAENLVSEASAKADGIVADAAAKAREEAERTMAESDEKLSENMKKVKYLYRRQDELAEIFKEHKAKVDSFFSSLPDTFGKKDDKK